MARGHHQNVGAAKEGLLSSLKEENDYYDLLRAAVQYDASFDEESRLTGPLEEASRISGRRRQDEEEFRHALTILSQDQTFSDPTKAMTPILLSGLCAHCVKSESPSLSPSDLVVFVENLRSQAIQDLHRNRKRTKFVYWVVAPMTVLSTLVGMLSKTLLEADAMLTRVGYTTITDRDSPSFQADSMTFRMLASHHPPRSFSMHLQLINETISWDEVTRETNAKSSRRYPTPLPYEESVVNQLIRETIQTHSKNPQEESVLDIGCGLGSTLYSLLPLVAQPLTTSSSSSAATTKRKQQHQPQLQYRGIGWGALEVGNARKLLQQYWKEPRSNGIPQQRVDANFVQWSIVQSQFLQARPHHSYHYYSYSTILAIEVFSYLEENGDLFLQAIHQSLKKDGILILVDDVIASDDKQALLRKSLQRPSLISHDEWKNRWIGPSGLFTLVDARALTLEYELLPTVGQEHWSSRLLYWVQNGWQEQYRKGILLGLRWLQKEGTLLGTLLSPWLHLLLLEQGAMEQRQTSWIRQQAHWDGDLQYHFYVLKKR